MRVGGPRPGRAVTDQLLIYVITYRPKGFVGPISAGGQVWKIGETAQGDWIWRAGISLAQCDLAAARVCDLELVGITARYPNKCIARWNEAAVVAKWDREVGKGNKCPPGQYPCR